MRWSQATEVGKVRQRNEDSILVAADIGLFAVADGMGGHRAGEVASSLALNKLEMHMRSGAGDNISGSLAEGVKLANSSVFETSEREAALKGMGTTLTAAVIKNNKVVLSHVGDSRAYVIRKAEITQLTRDHSLVQELYSVGGITRDQAREHPQRNILTRALGTDREVEVDMISIRPESGDVLLLCTDGLTSLVEDSEILEFCIRSRNLDEAAAVLIRAAMDRGGNDNISVILVEL